MVEVGQQAMEWVMVELNLRKVSLKVIRLWDFIDFIAVIAFLISFVRLEI